MARALLFTLLCFFTTALSAQLEIRHMQYNLTLYGNPFGCNEATNNTGAKDVALATIMEYVNADILAVNELGDEDQLADRILDEVLNDGDEIWERAELSDDVTFSSIVNALFYRADRLVLHEQSVVFQNADGGNLLRPVDFYTLYPITPGLPAGDTVFFTCIVAHLSAGNDVLRADQTAATMARVNEMGPGNYIFTGDLNIDSEFEEAFQNLIADSDPSIRFDDPIDVAPVWNNNPSVSLYHTQSTRFSDTNTGCFAPGGLDDRFDITLISPSLSSGSEGLNYVMGSYQVLGQSGNDFNQELQQFGNTVVPVSVANALYDMSDHLPVVTDYVVDVSTHLTASSIDRADVRLHADGLITVRLDEAQIHSALLYDMSGRMLSSQSQEDTFYTISTDHIATSMVLLHLLSDEGSKVYPLVLGY